MLYYARAAASNVVDRIVVPKTDEIRPVQDLIQEALTNRQDILQSKVNVESAKFLSKGDKNTLYVPRSVSQRELQRAGEEDCRRHPTL